MKTVTIYSHIGGFLFFLSFLTGALTSCSGPGTDIIQQDREPHIQPDYSGITIPPNIAPLNFMVNENGKKYYAEIRSAKGQTLKIRSGKNVIHINESKWKKLLEGNRDGDLLIDIYSKSGGKWTRYKTIVNHIAPEPIDSYLVYRLFDQGYVVWKKMGIYQRCLENYRVSPVMTNDYSEGGCMNCHSFASNNSNTMMLHTRQKLPGTVILRKGTVKFVNTATALTKAPGTYPSWNPDGRHIAFSVNQILQVFLSVPEHTREAIDTLADIEVYDTELNKMITCASIASPDRLETFPGWSPDGKSLYFCSAPKLPPGRFNELKYDLLRIGFNPESGALGKVDTMVSASRYNMSISLPRVSPDGKNVLFCMAAYGSFPIWHPESDLYILNMENGKVSKPDINSDFSEGYHSWSSNGRWIVFSSKRNDGFTTEFCFSYFDKDGKAHKPFVLPQKNPLRQKTYLKSYNIPEFVTSEIKLKPKEIAKIIRTKPVSVTFEN
ncbi:MAG TPA: hypothetical protein VK155_08930 [Bacteroidales bacterium]|nr:hypothetical protein [Bacteroidales bacterium]